MRNWRKGMRISRLNETARQRMFLRISEKIMMYEL